MASEQRLVDFDRLALDLGVMRDDLEEYTEALALVGDLDELSLMLYCALAAMVGALALVNQLRGL